MPRLSIGSLFALLAALLFVMPAAPAWAWPPSQQGGTVTTSVDVQLTIKPLCKSVSVAGNQIHFSAVPSTKSAVATFEVTYDCAANAVPTIAFLSKNGCYLEPDANKNSRNFVAYQILGAWGNQLACSPGEIQSRMQPISASPTTFTLKTAPLLDVDPHVFPAGRYGDTVIATLDF